MAEKQTQLACGPFTADLRQPLWRLSIAEKQTQFESGPVTAEIAEKQNMLGGGAS